MSLTSHPLGLSDINMRLRDGRLTAVALMQACLDRIRATEPEVRAWVRPVDVAGALAAAETADAALAAGCDLGPLHGIPVGIKDVIHIAGLPTLAGSPAMAGAEPQPRDAAWVDRIRRKGGIPLGKLHTTEFAHFSGPPPTRNPHDTRRTPGGSSAGPAAAIAAGQIPLSLGTQTAGSVIRPAAFCGVAAFKPTTGSTDTDGVIPFASRFDTLGWFAAGISDVVAAAPAFGFDPTPAPDRPLRIGVVRDPLFDRSDASMQEAVQTTCAMLRDRGHLVVPVDPAVGLSEISALHAAILGYQMHSVHQGLRYPAPELLGRDIAASIVSAAEISQAACEDALATLNEVTASVWQHWTDFDALLAPSAPGPAPEGAATGDPSFAIPFTALAGPIAALPARPASRGLPLGLQLVAAPGDDARLVASLSLLEACFSG